MKTKPNDSALTVEIWKDIEGYEGLYKVSNKGNIKSLPKNVTYSNGCVHYYEGRLMKSVVNNKNGYVYIGLTKNKKQSNFRLHRLVAKAFISNPNNFKEINHLDFNKINNSIDNLEWCDRFRQNQHAAKKPGRKWAKNGAGKFGKLNHKSKPVVQISIETNEILNVFESGCLAVKSIKGASQAKISACCLGHRKTHAGYKWDFVK